MGSIQSLEGFLLRRKLGLWKKKYFTVKNGKIYWGKNETARKANSNCEIKRIEKCEAIGSRRFLLVIQSK